MKASEVRAMPVDELNEKLVDLKEELFNLRFQLAANQLENTARIKAVRRILPVLRLHSVLRNFSLHSTKRRALQWLKEI